MKKSLAIMLLIGATVVVTRPESAAAQSCYDLWYQRNAIFHAYGYCFRTSLGRRVFGNAGCYTSNPRLSAADRRRVNRILSRERRLGCRVNR